MLFCLKKLCVVGNRLLNSISFKFSKDYSKLYENLVFIELNRRYSILFYYITKNNFEVDFLVFEKNKESKLIQVCYDVSNKNTLERETRALLEASKELKCKNLYILTKDVDKEEKGIRYILVWK